MASTAAAFRRIEQAKALLEEAQSLVEEKNNVESQVEELKRMLKEKEEQLLQKDKEIYRKGKELDGTSDELLRTRDAVKDFVFAELHKSNKSLEEAQLAHSNSPSRYSIGLVEIAKGTHAENEELLQRLASVVGVDINASSLNAIYEHEEKALATPPASPKSKPRKPLHQSRYIDRSPKFSRKSSPITV